MVDVFNGKADIEQINKWYRTAKEAHQDYRRRARTALKFYFGQQWSPEVEQKLKMEGKPALTINKIKPIIRTLCGYMRQSRKDLRVAPRRGGVHVVAETYTQLLKYIYDISYADWYNAMMFFDGVVGGKGWVSVDRDFTHDPISGDIVMCREDPFLIFEDPYSVKYDLSDARYVFRGRWMDSAQINEMFPEAKKAISQIVELGAEALNIEVEDEDYSKDDADALAQVAKQRYMVKECWYRSFERTKFISVGGTEAINVSHVSDEELKGILMQNGGSKVIERVMPRLRMAIVLGNTVLHEEDDPFRGSNRFPIVRFANELVYSDKMYVRGEVEDIISAQEEVNKRRSQSLHILNSTANSGFIVEKSAMGATEIRKLESIGSRPGVVVQVEDGGLAKVQRMTPAPLSEGHVSLSSMSDADMKAISGVNSDLLGGDKTASESGIAMEARRRQGLISLEPVFDNYDFTQRVLGDTLLEQIRNTGAYTPEEIASIVGGKVKTIDGQVVDEAQIMAFMQTKKGMYSVAMADMQNNPTIRSANFQQMLAAIKELQLPVSPDMIIENSDFPFKDQWLEKFKAEQAQVQQGAGMPQGAQGAPAGESGLPPDLEAEFQQRYAQEQGMTNA